MFQYYRMVTNTSKNGKQLFFSNSTDQIDGAAMGSSDPFWYLSQILNVKL